MGNIANILENRGVATLHGVGANPCNFTSICGPDSAFPVVFCQGTHARLGPKVTKSVFLRVGAA